MFEHKALTILRYQIGDTNISYPFRFRLIFSGIHDAAAVVSIASLKFENRFVYAWMWLNHCKALQLMRRAENWNTKLLSVKCECHPFFQ